MAAGNPSPLDISVVVNTKDRAESLRLCLNALGSQSLEAARWEIIVVDDGSRDDAPAGVARTFQGPPDCRVLRRDHGGCAAARNVGIEAASGRYVLFVGDDVVLEPDALAQHLAAHAKWPNAAIVGEYTWTPELPSATRRAWAESRRFDRVRKPRDASWRFFYTGNASVERAALHEVGGFDENFVRYAWEDMDLGVRLEKHGLKIVFHPRARGEHLHPTVSLRALCRAEYEQAFSAYYFFEKWRDDPDIQKDKFWQGDPNEFRIGPAWRKAFGRGLIHAAEALCPTPQLLDRLYGRLMWACRHEGLRDGAAHYASLHRET